MHAPRNKQGIRESGLAQGPWRPDPPGGPDPPFKQTNIRRGQKLRANEILRGLGSLIVPLGCHDASFVICVNGFEEPSCEWHFLSKVSFSHFIVKCFGHARLPSLFCPVVEMKFCNFFVTEMKKKKNNPQKEDMMFDDVVFMKKFCWWFCLLLLSTCVCLGSFLLCKSVPTTVMFALEIRSNTPRSSCSR